MRISDWSSDVCSSVLEHRGDLLQFEQTLNRVGPVDVAERVVAGRAAFPVRRVEQDNLLAAFAAETRRDFVVLTLNLEHDNRIRPLQQIGNDDADALARSRRGFEQYMLHLTPHEKAVDRQRPRLNS